MKLTIAIPFHRVGDYLLDALDSVRAQTRDDWCALVCDDGPESGIAERVEALGDARITYRRSDGPAGMASNWSSRSTTVADCIVFSDATAATPRPTTRG